VVAELIVNFAAFGGGTVFTKVCLYLFAELTQKNYGWILGKQVDYGPGNIVG